MARTGAISPVLSLQWHFCRLRDSKVSQFRREEPQFYFPTGLVPVDKGLATKTTRTQEVAPHPTLRQWKPGLKTMAGPASETLATNPRSFQTCHPLA